MCKFANLWKWLDLIAEQRYETILSELKKGPVTAAGLAEMLKVSGETVRRDFIVLEAQGKLRRVFGGAVPGGTAHRDTLAVRLEKNTEKKAELSRFAAEFIEEGDVIAIDAGSTAREFAKALVETGLSGITVVTYSDAVLNILKGKFRVIMTGGEYSASEDYFIGALAVDFLKNLHVNKAFIFPFAFSAEHGSETFNPEGAALMRALIDIADKTFILGDSDKIGARALVKVCEPCAEHIYVTDSKVTEEVRKSFADKGLVLICGED